MVLPCSQKCWKSLHYHCPLCKATIVRKCDSARHVQKHTKARPPLQAKRIKSLARNTRKIKCHVCGKELLCSNLKRHLMAEHGQQRTGNMANCTSLINSLKIALFLIMHALHTAIITELRK